MNEVKKTIIRSYPIILNGLRSVLNPVLSILFSYIVVTYFSKTLWGNFVEYLLLFFIVSLITNWGSKTYLMRAFSQNPANMVKDWQQLFIARIPICLVCLTVIPIIYNISIAIFLILWVLSAFIYASFFPVIFYNRDYKRLILIEIIGFFVLIMQLILYRSELDLILLIKSYAISIVLKVILSLIYYYPFLKFKKNHFNLKVLQLSFPFFLLGISGFLQSKIDVYAYSFFFEGKPLGEYQIITGFFIFSQSVVTMALFPYLKNIYRMHAGTILKLKHTVIKYGFIVHLTITTAIYFSLEHFFKIKLTLLQIVIGFFIGFPSYIYSIHVFYLFKKQSEKKVVIISSISLGINLLLSIILLYLDFNITGVLLANAIAQICCMSYYLQLKIND